MPDHILTMQPITKERVWALRGGLEEKEGKRRGKKKENREGRGREEDKFLTFKASHMLVFISFYKG